MTDEPQPQPIDVTTGPAPEPPVPDAVPDPVPEFTPFSAADFAIENVTFEGERFEKFLGIANELKLPKEAATSLVSMYAEQVSELQSKMAEEQERTWTSTKEQWVKEARELPEIGGANFDKTLSVIAKAIDKFGDSKVREAYDLTGAGDHPAILRFVYNMAKHLVEQPPVLGSPPGSSKSLAQRLYPGS